MSWLVDEVLLLLLLLLVSCVVVALVCGVAVVSMIVVVLLRFLVVFVHSASLRGRSCCCYVGSFFGSISIVYPCSDSCCSCLPPDTNALGFIEARHFEGRPRSLVFCVQDVFNMAPDFLQNSMQVCLQSKQASVRPLSPLSIPRTGGSVQHHAGFGSVNTNT